MLATLRDKIFDDPDWIYENKYDGYRTLAVINSGNVQLLSRNQISFNANFKSIADQLKKVNHTAILDGEVVVEDAAGRSDFQLLQHYIKMGKGKLKYYVFDLLNLDGNDITDLSLVERKELLEILLDNAKMPDVLYSKHATGNGLASYQEAITNKSEGIIAKQSASKYHPGKRNGDWLKIKIVQQEEAIIIGITEPKNSRSHFGALLLAQYEGKTLQYIGKCGTGFNETALAALYAKFKPHFIEDSPLHDLISIPDTVQWLKPEFVCQVKFTEWTQDNHLRHPVYLGLRIDKKAAEVAFTGKLQSIKNNEVEPTAKPIKRENDSDFKVGKVTLHLTNQNKIYFPDDGVTKGDIVMYYNEVADLMLPYLKDRPQSMNRFPNGINGPSFYQKDVDVDKIPTWLKTQKVFSESNDADIDYLICNDRETLLYMANLGCIEINPWNSTLKQIENPDWIVIDIDPEKEEFSEVVRTALVVKEVLDALDVACYCKTSGATGLHVYIPLGARYDYDQALIFAELIAHQVHSKLPDTTSLERSIKKRNHKIYIDFLQNRTGQTLAAPYSVRPKPGATVSTPLEWEEVNEALSPSQFTIKNVLKRFEKKGDLWKPVLGKGISIEKALKKIEQLNAG